MGKYYDMLMEDVRMHEGMKACMNCGVCTAVCPAAEFYNYDPRQIVSTVQTQDDEAIEALIRQRADAKKAKNFAEADRIRDELKARGIEVTDVPNGAKWKHI